MSSNTVGTESNPDGLQPDDHGLTPADRAVLATGDLPPMHHLGIGDVGQLDRMKMADYLGNISANTRVFLMLHGTALTFYNTCVAREGDPNEPITSLGMCYCSMP